ncbi:SDR family oxidoreductase [bacterium]|nr:SDR family oxidoreductase [bacterium]
MIDLGGRVALVTGSSRGIGRACALRLAQAGCDLVLNYLNSGVEARQLAEEVRQMGRRAALVKADVSEPEDIEAMLAFVQNQFAQLDILVSNVATGAFRPLLSTSTQQFNSVMGTNVMAMLHLVRGALPLLERSQGRAKVVAISSHGSDQALSHYGLIGASKAALEALTRHLALEIQQKVNLNVVLAGLVETDSTRMLGTEAFRAHTSRMMVGGRPLQADDVANAVLFLCSPLSDLVQGQTLVVDGGAGIHGS